MGMTKLLPPSLCCGCLQTRGHLGTQRPAPQGPECSSNRGMEHRESQSLPADPTRHTCSPQLLLSACVLFLRLIIILMSCSIS